MLERKWEQTAKMLHWIKKDNHKGHVFYDSVYIKYLCQINLQTVWGEESEYIVSGMQSMHTNPMS